MSKLTTFSDEELSLKLGQVVDSTLNSSFEVGEHIYNLIKESKYYCENKYECSTVAKIYKSILKKYNYSETAPSDDESIIKIVQIPDIFGDYHFFVAVNKPDDGIRIYYAYTTGLKIVSFDTTNDKYAEAIEFFKTWFVSYSDPLKEFLNTYEDVFSDDEEMYYHKLKELVLSKSDNVLIEDENTKLQQKVIEFIKQFNIHNNTLINIDIFTLYENQLNDDNPNPSIIDFLEPISIKLNLKPDVYVSYYRRQNIGGKRTNYKNKTKTHSKKSKKNKKSKRIKILKITKKMRNLRK
jgi:hypothetical protein